MGKGVLNWSRHPYSAVVDQENSISESGYKTQRIRMVRLRLMIHHLGT